MNSKGTTLIELVVVLLLVVIVAFFLAFITKSHYWIYNNETAELNITSSARIALDDIDNYVRQATHILSSYSSYTTGTQTLVLELPSIDSSSQVISGSSDTIVFYLTGTNFYRTVFPAQGSSRASVTKKLASNVDVSNFSFSYDNADYSLVHAVTTTMAIRETLGGQVRSITISSQSKLRNF